MKSDAKWNPARILNRTRVFSSSGPDGKNFIGLPDLDFSKLGSGFRQEHRAASGKVYLVTIPSGFDFTVTLPV